MPDRAVCSVEACASPVVARGWCRRHYNRWSATGSPTGSNRRSFEQRFWSKVQKTDECWLWLASCSTSGYGQFSIRRGVTRNAHIVAYELEVGTVPTGLELDHLCRNTACVNPAHLEPVTHLENVRRGLGPVVAGRYQRAKTHCPKDHPYDAENTIISPSNGQRHCRECKREFDRRRRAAPAAA